MKKQQKIGVLSTLVLLAIGSFGVPQNGWASVSPDTISADETTIKIDTNTIGDGTQYTISAITGDVAVSNTGLVTGGTVWTYLHQEKLALGLWSEATGTVGAAYGYHNSAADFATALGVSNTAADYATALGVMNTASEESTVAVGFYNAASAMGASALGAANSAKGEYSAAMGTVNTASEDYSTAVGLWNTAAGEYSSGMGINNTVYGTMSAAFGYSNMVGATSENDETVIDTSKGNNSYVFGGGNTVTANDALVLGAGFTASVDNSVIIGKAAVGDVGDSYTGNLVSVGIGNDVTGAYATALGVSDTATTGSTAVGYKNTAKRYGSALGYNNFAVGNASTALGRQNVVSGAFSVAIGDKNIVGSATVTKDEYGQISGITESDDNVTGEDSYVFGVANTIKAVGSFVFGAGNKLLERDETYNFVIGSDNNFAAKNAFVIGSGITTVADNSVVIGNGSSSEDENTVSVGSAALQRKIVHVAAGTVNTDVATYGQLIAAKDGGYQVASTDANTAQSVELEYNDGDSNATKVKITVAGAGKVASGDKRLVDGGTVYDAIAESLAQSGYTGSDTITINTAKQISVKNMTQGTDGSLSLGSQAEASGQSALAVGAGVKATGEKTSVFGSANIVNGKQSTAVGYDNSLTGTQSVAVGTENKVTNSGSATVGYQNWNYGYASSVYGSGNYTIGDYSTAIGYGNGAYGADSSAVGYGNAAMAEKSAAFGSDNEARGKNSIAVGVGNIVTAAQGMAFGYNSYAGTGAEGTADATGAVAIGNAAVNTETGTVSFGHKKDDFTGLYSWTYEGKKYYRSVKDDDYNTPETYDSDQFARLTNVADGIDNHDVATYGQLVNAQAIKDDSGNVTGYTAYELKAGEETEIKNNAGGTAFKLKLAMASGEIASGDGGYVTGGDIYQELRPADSGTYNYIGKTKEGGTKYTTADNLIALDSQVKTNADAIGTINTNVTTLTGDVSTLKRDVSTMKTNVETLTGDVSTLKTDVSDIKGSITDMSTKIEGSKLDGGEYVFSRNDNSKAIQYANQGGTAFTITIKGLGEGGGGTDYDAGNGIAINDNEISVNLAEKSGLSASESGLAVKVAENGGLTVDDNGLAVQKDGKIESGNTGIVTGGTVYDAISSQTGDATRLSAAGLGDNLTDSVLTVNDRVGNLSNNINKVGAGAAALAALHPESYDPADKWSFAVGYGHYKNANAGALGAFFKPNADTTLSVGGTIGNGDSMMNAGISFKLGSRSDKGVYRGAVAVSQELASLRKHTDQLTADNQILKKDNLMQAQKIANLEANNERMQRQIQMILSQLQMSNRVARTAR